MHLVTVLKHLVPPMHLHFVWLGALGCHIALLVLATCAADASLKKPVDLFSVSFFTALASCICALSILHFSGYGELAYNVMWLALIWLHLVWTSYDMAKSVRKSDIKEFL